MNTKHKNFNKVYFAFSDLFALNIINLATLSYIDRYSVNLFLYIVFCIFSNICWTICSFTSAMYLNSGWLNNQRIFSRTCIAFICYNCFSYLFALSLLRSGNNSYIFYDICYFALFLSFTRSSYIILSSYPYKTDGHSKKNGVIDRNDLNSSLSLANGINGGVNYDEENPFAESYATKQAKSQPALYKLAEPNSQSFAGCKFELKSNRFLENKYQTGFIKNTTAISLRNDPLSDISALMQKRVFDVIIASFILLFLLSWLIPILAVLIKLDSRGPVFFTQLRSGKNNIPFRIIKLRSLRRNIDADSRQVTRGDGRITQLGRFLRKTNLDELPQFFNVLAGNMSIIGSRPHMLKHTEEYALLHNNYMLRHSTKPGITGWAQVNGYRGEIKEPQQLQKRIEHDIWYMENWNIALDFKIVYLTVIKTLFGDENAF
jgi:putative colanic acid biosysnthesis UDP-glucose lipid carrier transferase